MICAASGHQQLQQRSERSSCEERAAQPVEKFLLKNRGLRPPQTDQKISAITRKFGENILATPRKNPLGR
jgi:hypothetical protein